MSGPPPETMQDRTQTKNTHSPRIEIKFFYPAGYRARDAGLEGRDSNDYATEMDHKIFLIKINIFSILLFQPEYELFVTKIKWTVRNHSQIHEKCNRIYDRCTRTD